MSATRCAHCDSQDGTARVRPDLVGDDATCDRCARSIAAGREVPEALARRIDQAEDDDDHAARLQQLRERAADLAAARNRPRRVPDERSASPLQRANARRARRDQDTGGRE
jgi:hypothetical protein